MRHYKNKKGGCFAAAPLGNVFFRPSSELRFLLWPFAQTLRELFSPRSSESFLHRLAIALLRVYAPEVKHKFKNAQVKKGAR